MPDSQSIELCWSVNQSASCMYAAEMLRRHGALADARLAAAIGRPLAALLKWVQAAGAPADQFMMHLVAVASEVDNNRELARVVLRKTLGAFDRDGVAVSGIAGAIADLEAAVHGLYPKLVEELSQRGESLKEAVAPRLQALLAGVRSLTDERLVPQRAEIVLVWPVQDGGGMACLLYNRVLWNAMPRAEAAPHAPPAPPALLPEELRLAWLLSQLNTDVPIFSEHVKALRLPRVAELAMLPPVLTAAREQGVLPEGDFLAQALAAWCGPKQSALAPVVQAWWRTCRQLQFAWNVALQALDHALVELPLA